MYVFMCMLLLLHIVCYLNGRTLFCANICRCVNVCAESALNGSSILIVQIDMQHYEKSTKSPKQQQKTDRERKKPKRTHTAPTSNRSLIFFLNINFNIMFLISFHCLVLFSALQLHIPKMKNTLFLSLRVKAAKFIQHNFFDLVMK